MHIHEELRIIAKKNITPNGEERTLYVTYDGDITGKLTYCEIDTYTSDELDHNGLNQLEHDIDVKAGTYEF